MIKNLKVNRPSYKKGICNLLASARVIIVVLLLFAITLAIYHVEQFKIDASADTLLVKNNKLFIESQLAAQRFNPEEFILVAYKPETHDLFSDKTFQHINNLASDFNKLNRVEKVTSILNVPLLDSETSLIGTDVKDLTWQQQQYSAEQMAKLLDRHPIYTGLLVNQKASATAIQIVFKPDPKLVEIEQQILDVQKHALERPLRPDEEALIEKLEQLAAPIKAKLEKAREQEIRQIQKITDDVTGASIYMGGPYVVGFHLIDIIKSDLVVFGSAIAVTIALLLAIIYRSFQWVVFPLLICGVSVVTTIGLFGFLGLKTTVISANFIALQLILTLAVMVHLMGAYRRVARDHSHCYQRERVVKMLENKLAPCFYATVTTSVGFGSLLFSGIQPVADFGFMMLLAMIVTMSMSLLLFPALLSFLPPSRSVEESNKLLGGLVKVHDLAIKTPLKVSLCMVFVFCLLGFGITKIVVENSFIDYFNEHTRVYKELSFIDTEFGGSTPLDIILDVEDANKNEDLIISANSLNRLHLAHASAEAFEATGSLTSLVSFTKLAKQVNDQKPLTEYELNTLYSMLDKETSEQLLGGYLDDEGEKLRIAIRIIDTLPSLNRQAFLQDLKADLESLGIGEDSYQLTNLFVLYEDILSRLVDSQINTITIVYAALLVVLIAIFKSIKIALIALVPNILSTIGILGLIGWFGIPLDLMTITIAAIAMGIAMDDTIHFVDNTLHGKDTHAIKSAFTETGVAIVYTSLIIAVGFSLFVFSDFLPSVYFGMLAAAAMLLALITDLTVLPALLHRFVLKERKHNA